MTEAKNSGFSSKVQKKKDAEDISDKIILNFKYDDFDPNNEKYHPRFRKRQDYIQIDDVNILDQNRFRFIINNYSSFNDTFTKYKQGNYTNITWKDIKIVIYYCVENYQCPICLENEMICPVITNCGHVFCWPCLISYYNFYTVISVNKKIPKCPLCSNKIDLAQNKQKFCEIVKCYNYTTSDNNNNVITFNLIMRDKLGPNLYNTFFDQDLSLWKESERYEMKRVPYEENDTFSFGRVFYSSKELMRKRFQKYKEELEKGLKEELDFYADETRIACLNQCLEEIKKVIEDNEKKEDYNINEYDKEEDNTNNEKKEEHKENEYQIDYKKYFFFYQENYGDIYFLHPLLYEIFLEEYKTEGDLPTEIQGKILDIEMHQITYQFKKMYPFLNHLRVGSLIFFVEIEIGNLVSPQTKKKFATQLKERSKYRRLLSKEEKNYENFIKKKASKEEKENLINFAASAPKKNTLEDLKEEEKENIKEEVIEPKESMLKKLLIGESEIERKEEEKKEKENEQFMFKEDEFPELDNNNIVIKNTPLKKGGKKKNAKQKFKTANDELINQISIGFSVEEDDDNKKNKKNKKEKLKDPINGNKK